jgi:cytochrome P450
VQRLLSEGVENTPVNLFMAIRCASYDIITAYCLNLSSSALTSPCFMHPFLVSSLRFTRMFWVFKYFPIIRTIMNLPPFIFNILPENIRNMFEFRHQVDAQINHILANPDFLLGDNQRETIYYHLLGYGEMGQRHRALGREELLQEAETMLLAGSETIGNTMTIGVFHVLNNQDILRRLVSELDAVWPNNSSDIPFSTLEKLPYLVNLLNSVS